jgi:16S rRNA (cytidine1402-2'-O)-methyltransferase
MLTIIPTPLGNLKDITLRTLETLQVADFFIAENPAHSSKLLQHYAISKKPIYQFAEHNETKVLSKLIELLKQQHGGLMTDAGTPGISDPGFRLVRSCIAENIEVDSLPGPTAGITALAASGLPTDRFLFVGFLPKTEPKLLEICHIAIQSSATLVAYDSPQRITKTLGYIAKSFPIAKGCVARELTKMHQEYLRGTVPELLGTLNKRSTIKGEITLLISFK